MMQATKVPISNNKPFSPTLLSDTETPSSPQPAA